MPKKKEGEPLVVQSHPAMTTESYENHMINLAMSRAEQQIMDGTASSQVIVHFLKLGTERAKNRLEIERLEEENKLLRAKTEAIQSASDTAKIYRDAIRAMGIYQGRDEEEMDEEY